LSSLDSEGVWKTVRKKVVAYTTSWCPDCTRSKRVLQRAGVSYQEIDIEEVKGAEEEMRARNGGSGKVPTIFIGDKVLIEPSDVDLRQALHELIEEPSPV
jgi:mycoredoxin